MVVRARIVVHLQRAVDQDVAHPVGRAYVMPRGVVHRVRIVVAEPYVDQQQSCGVLSII